MRTKINIKNERNRINHRCSSPTKRNSHQEKFDNLLRLNGYPQHSIDKTHISTNNTSVPTNTRTLQSTNTEWLYLTTPFISEKFDHKLKSIFKQEGFNIRIVHKSNTLRQALRTKRTQNTCKLTNCIISNTKCCQRGVIYKVTCHKCSSFYIGSTIRQLH